MLRPNLKDSYDLGGQLFVWKLAVAGYRLGINPFDQPKEESAKVRARELVARFISGGSLPDASEVAARVSAAAIRLLADLWLPARRPQQQESRLPCPGGKSSLRKTAGHAIISINHATTRRDG